MLLPTLLLTVVLGSIHGDIVCDGCPPGPVHVVAYPAVDRYNWPWWNVYGFLQLFHGPGVLDAMRPAPVAAVRLERPGPFNLEIPGALGAPGDVYLFALLDADGDGLGSGATAPDWVGRFPRNPVARGRRADDPVELSLYPLIWGPGFEAQRYHPRDGDRGGLAFVDATEAAGIDFRHCQGGDIGHLPVVVGSGALLDDLDGDRDLDLFVVQGMGSCPGASTTSRLYLNDGSGHFRDATAGSGLALRATGMGVAGADYDADGDLDLYVTTLDGGRLFRNDGGARFTDVTAVAGVGDDDRWAVGASFGDVDGDGRLDLYVANYVTFTGTPPFTADAEIPSFVPAMLSSPFAFPAQANRLYLNLGGGRFREAPDALGAADADGKGMAAVLVDLDRDGDRDLYVTNDCTKDSLFEFRDGRFIDVSRAAGVDDVSSGMGIALGDVNGDGRADIFSPHWMNEPAVYYEGGPGLVFRERTAAAGLAASGNGTTGWASEFFDADLDGDLDLFVAAGHTHPGAGGNRLEPQLPQLFVNTGGRFRDVSCALVEAVPEPAVYRGAALGDIDGDGDVDLYLVRWNGTGRLLRNDSQRAGRRWLQVDLMAKTGERGAIGARVALGAGSGRVVRDIVSGTGYLSHSSLTIEHGYRGPGGVGTIGVTWADGAIECFPSPDPDRHETLAQGTGNPCK